MLQCKKIKKKKKEEVVPRERHLWVGKLVRGYLRKDLHIKKQGKQLQVPKVGAPKKESLLNLESGRSPCRICSR